MNKFMNRLIVGVVLGFFFNTSLSAGVVDPALEARLKTVPADQPISIMIALNTRADTNAIKEKVRAQRRAKIIQALQDHANLKQASLLAFLKANGGTDIRPLWIVNSVAAKCPAGLIRKLAKRPGVASVYTDEALSISVSGSGASSSAVPEWNLSAIHAPDLWALGHTAQGIVVANMDSGVDGAHPDLSGNWRGGSNSWYDPHGQYAAPTDYAGAISGHGTQTMGLIVGGSSGGTALGAAPGAQWIAVKIFNSQGTAQESHFHQSFQWLLDPDNNPLTDDAPDVVNGSFQTSPGGVCDTRFQADVQLLKSSGTAVVFAAGNTGPSSSSSTSPANNPGSFAAGAVDSLSNVAAFSARGPAPVDCGGALFPNTVAPGVDVYTTDLTFAGEASYTTVSGTSFAAPHIAGGMALLMGAFPDIAVTALESALQDSATDLGLSGPDNEYGYGLLNVLSAYHILADSGQNPVGLDDSYILDEDAVLSVPAPGVLENDSDPQSNPITALIDTEPSHGTLVLNPDGSFSYVPASDYYGTDSFTYKVTDGIHQSGIITVGMTINPVNDAPVARADTVVIGSGGSVTIPVLSNDSDPENSPLTPVLDSSPLNGVVSVTSDGAVLYTHNVGSATGDSFTYHVTDGDLTSSSVTVNITISTVPVVATPDSYTVDEDKVLNVPSPGILNNDSSNIKLSAQLVRAPAHAASFILNGDGSFSYTPAADFNGADDFVYAASDGNSLSDDTSVVINVEPINDPPVTADDGGYTVMSGQVLNVSADSGVLANDADLENDPLSAVLVSPPSSGILSLNTDGSFSYSSEGVPTGTYSFSYVADDGAAVNSRSRNTTATIQVISNTAPTANGDTFLYRTNIKRSVNAAGPLGIGVLQNDTDAENNPLTAQYVANSLSGGGTLNFSSNGSFTYTRNTAANAGFRYRANDGALLSLPSTGTSVSLRADAPPTTAPDNCTYDLSSQTATAPERCTVLGSRTIKMALSSNDTDPNKTTNVPTDGIGSTVVPGSTIVTSAGTGVNVQANAQCGQSALGSASASRGTITNNCDGTVTLKVANGNKGSNVVYSYRVSDDLGAQSNARSVTLSVQP